MGKKLSSKHRKDLDEISEKTRIPLKSCRRQVGKSGRGDSRFGLDEGLPLKLQNPYPFLKTILTKKVSHFRDLFYTGDGIKK